MFIKKNENIKFIEPESGPSLSVKKALNGLHKPCLVTTGDHPLLTADTVKLLNEKIDKYISRHYYRASTS